MTWLWRPWRAPLAIAACLALAAGLRWAGGALLDAAADLEHDVWDDGCVTDA